MSSRTKYEVLFFLLLSFWAGNIFAETPREEEITVTDTITIQATTDNNEVRRALEFYSSESQCFGGKLYIYVTLVYPQGGLNFVLWPDTDLDSCVISVERFFPNELPDSTALSVPFAEFCSLALLKRFDWVHDKNGQLRSLPPVVDSLCHRNMINEYVYTFPGENSGGDLELFKEDKVYFSLCDKAARFIFNQQNIEARLTQSLDGEQCSINVTLTDNSLEKEEQYFCDTNILMNKGFAGTYADFQNLLDSTCAIKEEEKSPTLIFWGIFISILSLLLGSLYSRESLKTVYV